MVKNALRNYNELMMLARKGDQVAHIICIDIKQAIHAPGVLSFKQRRYLGLWWQGFSYIEIATMYRLSPSVIKRRVDLATSNISCFLCKKGNIYPVECISKGKGLF